MPDLLSHGLIAYLCGARLPPRRLLWLIAGTVLPDAAAQAPIRTIDLLGRIFVWKAPDWLFLGAQSFHSLLPLALLCWGIVLLVPERHRRGLFSALYLGGLLHLALDLLQRHLVGAVYYPLYPLDLSWSADVMWTETSFYFLPFLAALALWVRAWRRRHGPPAAQGGEARR